MNPDQEAPASTAARAEQRAHLGHMSSEADKVAVDRQGHGPDPLPSSANTAQFAFAADEGNPAAPDDEAGAPDPALRTAHLAPLLEACSMHAHMPRPSKYPKLHIRV